MKKTTIFLAATLLACTTYGQQDTTRSITGITIEPGIKTEVEKHISTASARGVPSEAAELVYNNTIIADMYENDRQVASLTSASGKKSMFKSFYYWQGDTLGIDGAFGMYTGVGFSIKIAGNKAWLYHLVSAGETPAYAYREKDDLTYRLEVPCSDTKIVLSEVPDAKTGKTVYGYVEFKSNSYFQSKGSADGRELLPRKKERADMKIYFRSTKLVLP